jgi:hypothetical protein
MIKINDIRFVNAVELRRKNFQCFFHRE